MTNSRKMQLVLNITFMIMACVIVGVIIVNHHQVQAAAAQAAQTPR